MKLFKNFLMCLCTCVLALGFASCGGDDDDDSNPGGGGNSGGGTPSATVEKEVKLENSEATTVELNFDAAEDWKLEKDAEWFTTNLQQGIAGSNKKLTVRVQENLTTDERTGHITIKAIRDGKAIAKFTLVQSGYEEKESDDINPSAPEGMKKNASGIVKSIKVGWNLGNTFEATDQWIDKDTKEVKGNAAYVEGGANLFTETSWQGVKTTKEMIVKLKEAGFNGIRIPVRWYRHADSNLNINAEWMNRVKEVTKWCVDEDMYVIINSHHDNWYDRMLPNPDSEGIKSKFSNMWKQIATSFKEFDEHVIFAAVNEVIADNNGPWVDGGEIWPWSNGTTIQNGPSATQAQLFEQLLQIFVDEVRNTGGNNAWRNLMVQPWAANPDVPLNLPADKVSNRLIFEFHCYDPYDYATAKKVHTPEAADANYKTNITNKFKAIRDKYISKLGIPVIMAEFGSTQDNSSTSQNSTYDKTRADYHKFIVSEAKKNGIPGFYWDNNASNGGETFVLLDRATCKFSDRAKIALDGIMNGLK